MENLFWFLWILVGLYTLAGIVFAAIVHLRGLQTLDEGANGASIVFRILITPGLIALWPVMFRKLRDARRSVCHFGNVEAPYKPKTLRKAHGLVVIILAVMLPILLGVALLFRPTWRVEKMNNVPLNAAQTVQGDRP